jgi:ubiquinone/menaquinone biosynthesis C-methylase UbiE
MEREGTFIHDFDPDFISDYFGRLERQGPGNREATLKALSCIDNLSTSSEIADLACGTGGQTITIAQSKDRTITGLDISSKFIDKFNENIKRNGLENRVNGIVGSMAKLPFEHKHFDVIWSEGAIASIGFENCLMYWREF